MTPIDRIASSLPPEHWLGDWLRGMAAPEIPARVRGAAAIYSATGALLIAAGPIASTPEPAGARAVVAGVGALAVALLLFAGAARFTAWMLHVALVGAIGLGSLALGGAGGPGGAMAPIAAMLWIGAFVGALYESRTARVYAGLLGSGLVAGWIAGGSGETAVLISFVLTIVALVEGLSRITSRLRAAALTDPLTGLLNRNGLRDASRRAIAACRRSGQPLAVAVIDLDDFKQVNDRKGHAAGDRLLRLCAETWQREIRAADVLARLGGDEFVLVLPGNGCEAAERILRRLHAGSPTGWSYGVAELERGEEEIESCVARADVELYMAKGGIRGHDRGVAVPGARVVPSGERPIVVYRSPLRERLPGGSMRLAPLRLTAKSSGTSGPEAECPAHELERSPIFSPCTAWV